MSAQEQKDWIYRPNTIKWIVRLLLLSCVALAGADFFVHKHSYFSIEDYFAFYAIFSFMACFALVVVAKAIRVILKRKEDYYDK